MHNLSFEDKINLMAATPPGPKKHALIQKFASSDTTFFKAINASTMPFDQYMALHAEEFRLVAQKAKSIRDNVRNHGWTDKKYQKLTGEVPERMLNERPEFSSSLSRKQFSANMKWFLNKYPQFKVE